MPRWAQLEKFTMDAGSAQGFGELTDICIRYFQNFGVVMSSYLHMPPPGATDYDPTIEVATVGFPQEWVEIYRRERLYECDPIPVIAFDTMAPVWWSDAARDPRLSAVQKAYFERVSEARLGDGLGIPMFGPWGRNAYAGLGFGGPRPDLGPVQIHQLHLACQIGHRRYCQLLLERAPDDIRLSPREAEILTWTAKGKSNSVIAELMGISANTVDTHLRRIYTKMGVSDRITAALRGMAIGVIGRQL